MMLRGKRWTWTIFLGIMLLGWGVRELYGISRPWPGRDEVYYMDSGLELRNNSTIELKLRQPVLLFWVIAQLPAGTAPMDDIRIVKNFIRWYSLLLLPPFWLIGMIIFRSRRGAALLMLLAALAPFAMDISNSVLREGLYLPLCGWLMLILVLIIRRPRWQWFWLQGGAIGLGLTMRKEALEWELLLLLATIIMLCKKNWKWYPTMVGWSGHVICLLGSYVTFNLLCGVVPWRHFHQLADGFVAYF